MEKENHLYWLNFIQGDDLAFRQLYEHYIDLLYTFGCHYSRDESLVKDSIHDLFIELHNYRSKLSQNVNVKFYLLKSLKRIIFRALKKQALLEEHHEDGVYFLRKHQISTEWNIETLIIQNESEHKLFSKIDAELRRLPARQQEAIYLKYHSGFSYEEVSELMRISVPTCRTLVYRGIKQLRASLHGTVPIEIMQLTGTNGHSLSPLAFPNDIK